MNSEVADQATFLNAQGFTGVQALGYWSSSSYADSVAHAWVVTMSVGLVTVNNKAVSFYVWPVRTGH